MPKGEKSLNDIKKTYSDLLNKLGDPKLISDWERFEELTKEKKRLDKIIEKDKEISAISHQIEENKAILRSEDDPELSALAQVEISQLQEKEKKMREDLEKIINEENNPKEPKFDSAIIEIRAGAGGEEASLFAADLLRMYSKYALSQSWNQKILDSHPTELGGIKEVIFEIKGDNAYSKIKNEAGVHRVQRIPKTEKTGRIHTSTATVAVLPKPKTTEIKIKPDELKIDVFRSSGPGGQNVNKRETAVRITHLPTRIVVASQTERNQLQNKENAMSILYAKLQERKQSADEARVAGNRKTQIGSAKRAEKIRTYNFPQDRVTDHRVKKNWHNIEKILEGEIGPIIDALQKI